MSTAASSAGTPAVAGLTSSLEEAAGALRRDYTHLQSEAAQLDRAVRGLRWTGRGAEQWRTDVTAQIRAAEDIAVQLRQAAWRIEQVLAQRLPAGPSTAPAAPAAGSR
jgi:hypothetical protein